MKKIFIFLLFIIGVFGAIYFQMGGESKSPDRQITLAEPGSVWWNAPILVAGPDQFYEDAGVDVTRFEVTTGLASKNAVVQENADVGVSASTPLVVAASRDEDLLVLGRYMLSTSLLGIITQDQEINWKEKIGYVPATISELYLIAYLEKNNLLDLYTKKELNLVGFRPTGLKPAFVRKDVQSVVGFEPFISQILDAAESGNKFNLVKDEAIFSHAGFILTRRDVWEKKKDDVEAFLSAIKAVSTQISQNEKEFQSKIEELFDYEKGWLDDTFQKVDFSYSDKLVDVKPILEREAELAVRAGIIATAPDFTKVLSELK